jgi:hypothetical protein
MTVATEVKTNPNPASESRSKGTNVTFGATAGMPSRFKGNFDYQFVRTMGCVFTRSEHAQNHCQVGNMGLAFRVMIDWMTGLGPIERPINE